MEPSKGIRIPQPCNASWEKMNPVKDGRYCNMCSKTVVDFTTKTVDEIRKFISRNSKKKICGHFRKDQVEQERSYFPPSPPLWIFAVAIFYAFGASLFDMNKHPLTQAPPPEPIHCSEGPQTLSGLILGQPRLPTSDSRNPYNQFTTPVADKDTLLKSKRHAASKKEPPLNPDVMPEFRGGVKALNSFLSSRIHFPEMEREKDLNGTVIVRILIDVDGKVTEVEIMKSISPGFDKEALRVAGLLPAFKPARLKGNAVSAYYYLPFKFLSYKG
jgi:protein TonB